MTKKAGGGAQPVLVLFRKDLRIADNGALAAAAESGAPVVLAFVHDTSGSGGRAPGGASLWWLHHSLKALGDALTKIGAPLILRSGQTSAVVDALIAETNAGSVFWNRRYDPAEIEVDTALKASLRERGLTVKSFDGHLLHEPSLLKTKSGGPYKVYSPFWRGLAEQPEPRPPIDAPALLKALTDQPKSEAVEKLVPLPRSPDWAGGLRETWTPGEAAAHQRLAKFLKTDLAEYEALRDRPDRKITSRLSPHLAHGEITPFQILAALRSATNRSKEAGAAKFHKEVAWREFSYHLLFHNPKLASENYQSRFDAFPWKSDSRSFAAWKRGQTGYPIVDAGMRELWQTGIMHNRVRMIAASFLIKHLMIDWREGEAWFWDTLVDADCANNPASWQWVAGSGADAAPYFRIFNPVLQGEKFDPKGDYVRTFVPELAKMPETYVHRPWEAPKEVLSKAGLKLGDTYPWPIIALDEGRDRALAAYKALKEDA